MTRAEYVTALKGLLSGSPEEIKEANRVLYHELVPVEAYRQEGPDTSREADLVLAEVAS